MINENTFQDKIKMEMENAKKELFHEEIQSVLYAIGFASSLAHTVIASISGLTLLSLFFTVFFVKKFKPTVKKQFIIAKHMDFLKNSMKEKVWTLKD